MEDASPWPTFRRDSRNTGYSPLPAAYQGDQPWSFQTGKGIFSTPVIDASGAVYVGSADHYLYALNPDGSLKWKYLTGGIINSAGALGRFDPQTGYAPLTFISGDGYMYHFRTDDGIPDPAQRLLWKFQAELRPGVSYNRWFEGNVAIGPDGTLYAGNTNFNYYAIHPDGTPKWTFSTTSNNWSQSAFAADGTIYWGSLDTFIHAVAPDGLELWNKRTLGFVAASAAVGSDGTVYIGSFDSNLYALDPLTGKTRWTFPTNDHIYSSAALGADAKGNTTAIYFGSADGTFYAVSPQGKLLWKYDTGDPIRSSPAVGLDPGGGGGQVVYFGCGNGKLYAINAADGALRWSFDTTPQDPELRDRNDLNGSPALGQTGVYIGGEHGFLWYLPYDYCLHSTDPRCTQGEGQKPGPGRPRPWLADGFQRPAIRHPGRQYAGTVPGRTAGGHPDHPAPGGAPEWADASTPACATTRLAARRTPCWSAATRPSPSRSSIQRTGAIFTSARPVSWPPGSPITCRSRASTTPAACALAI